MDYRNEFRKFITSQYLSIGIRTTAGIIIPGIVLYHYGLLGQLMAIPLGVLCVSLTDNPGPPHHRKNGIIISILLNFLVAVIIGLSSGIAWLLSIEIVVFGMLFTLIGVYGSRASSIGAMALLVFILNLDNNSHHINTWENALWLTVGGVWYAILSAVLYRIRPYKIAQQLMGTCLLHTADFLKTKAKFYETDPDYNTLTTELLGDQVLIQQDHGDLREVLFKTRRIVSESTVKSRTLMLMFLDSIDLFERLMTSQQDYKALHKVFDHTGILEKYKLMLLTLSNQLNEIAIAVQGGTPSKMLVDLDEEMQQTKQAYDELKVQYGGSIGTEEFGKLKSIYNSMQDITERIKRLHSCTTYDKKLSKQYKRESDLDVQQFVGHQEFDPRLLIDNLSLKSTTFRHACQLTIALLAGYIVSLLFPLGHGYWILLTISTIIKPSYSITRNRNIHRLLGTLLGGIIGFAGLYLFPDNSTVLFVVMLVAMLIAYSFLRLASVYWLSTAAITVYVLLSFYFLNPKGYQNVLSDRVIDTVIGSGIAFIVSILIFPGWAKRQIWQDMIAAVKSNRKYFDIAAGAFAGTNTNVTEFKLVRKSAFVALANLSDDLRRMLSEPKNKNTRLLHFHQFVGASHMLTSHIAALSYYAQYKATKFASKDFFPLVHHVDLQLEKVVTTLEGDENTNTVTNERAIEDSLSLNEKVRMLLDIEKKHLEDAYPGDAETVNKTLISIKNVTNQFELINTIAVDEVRILKKILA